jgi:hypothetical protein
MKKPLSVKQHIDFSKLLFNQENTIKSALDEMVIFESFLRERGNMRPSILSMAEGRTQRTQARRLKEILKRFRIRSCSMRIKDWHKYYLLISHITLAVFHTNFLIESSKYIHVENSLKATQKMRLCLELSLDTIIELKQKNGID